MLIKIISWLVLSCFVHGCYGACSLPDRDSLSSFNLSASAAPPLNWSLSVDCCSWEGIDCDESSRVISLSVPSRGLMGSISPSIMNLTALSRIDLSSNSLLGPVPCGFFASFGWLQVVDLSSNYLSAWLSEIDTLPASVRTVNLSNNNFHGTIPSSFLERASNLEMLDVSNNDFFGSIPSSICSFASTIQSLDFSWNDFAGKIPPGFGYCSNLQRLRAGFNNLSGEIPHSIYRLIELQELYLPNNNLSGQMDESIANLINLKILALHDNKLTGTIPQNIGKLSTLEHLLLHRNQLSGSIPPSLTNCTRLMLLQLGSNYLEGELSAFDFSGFDCLTTIRLMDNLFTGALPKSLFTCRALTLINLSYNNFNGEIPPNIVALQSLISLFLYDNSLINIPKAIRILSRCKNLTYLFLGKNFYNEEIPGNSDIIGSVGLRNLQALELTSCGLTGPVPRWLSKLANLKVLILGDNRITGPIPGFIGDLPNLFYLGFWNNSISGHFPSELARLPALTWEHRDDDRFRSIPVTLLDKRKGSYRQVSYVKATLHLADNRIAGTIPAEIGRLKSLHLLVLSNNDFSGTIPNTISNLTNLEMLDLAGNHLSGEIPASIKNLHFLSSFNVSHNNLEGRIPTGGQFHTFPQSSFEGNPWMCGQGACRGQDNPDDYKPADRKHQEIINWYGFGIGYVISFIASVLVALKFIRFCV